MALENYYVQVYLKCFKEKRVVLSELKADGGVQLVKSVKGFLKLLRGKPVYRH